MRRRHRNSSSQVCVSVRCTKSLARHKTE
jgi:hypothetical protein